MNQNAAIDTTIFSAEEPSLGYFYQLMFSLLLLIQSSEMEDAKITIEKLDDVVLLQPDNVKLYQMKYHINSVANLTDRSSDLWKTLRVWCTLVGEGKTDLLSTSLHLITTAPVSENSIVKEFTKGLGERNINNIVAKLDAIASETSNHTNKAGYAAYNNLSNEYKMLLVSRIYVCDSSIGIEEIKNKIHSELRKTIIDDKVSRLYEYLSGWYLGKVIQNLQGDLTYISFKDYQSKCFEIIDTLKIDNLPADFLQPVDISGTELETYKERTFVKQLNIIGIKGKGLNSAISDYYRAFEQRSKWSREGSIKFDEEITYEHKLFDDWKRKFDSLMNVESETTDDEKLKMGKSFYENFYVSNYPKVFIRERFDHIFMITGSCHILSDSRKIGWHPEFQKKL